MSNDNTYEKFYKQSGFVDDDFFVGGTQKENKKSYREHGRRHKNGGKKTKGKRK